MNESEKVYYTENDEVFMRTFSSQEEAELFRLKQRLQRTDWERFQQLCRMIKIGKMLTPSNLQSK